MEARRAYRAACLIGRFQPFHAGHLLLAEQALTLAHRLVVVIGSAHQARTPKNPWTWEERAEWIRKALGARGIDERRLHFVPVRDYYDEDRWREAMLASVSAALSEGESEEEARRPVALVGHFKDESSSYLANFSNWELISLPRQGGHDAVRVRAAYFSDAAQALVDFDAALPKASKEALESFAESATYRGLKAEAQSLEHYKKLWSVAPFPPVFVTVDAVVTCGGRVLLIQRGHAPGKGLWALPGGFLELAETTFQSALRELKEETTLDLGEHSKALLVGQRVFDHPLRSLRGRTISHVYHFDLGNGAPPRVQAADDAALAEWLPIPRLLEMEPLLFDDHFHVLDHFLKIL